jgi:hypothetical protein
VPTLPHVQFEFVQTTQTCPEAQGHVFVPVDVPHTNPVPSWRVQQKQFVLAAHWTFWPLTQVPPEVHVAEFWMHLPSPPELTQVSVSSQQSVKVDEKTHSLAFGQHRFWPCGSSKQVVPVPQQRFEPHVLVLGQQAPLMQVVSLEQQALPHPVVPAAHPQAPLMHV